MNTLPSYSEHDAWRIETSNKNIFFCFYFRVKIIMAQYKINLSKCKPFLCKSLYLTLKDVLLIPFSTYHFDIIRYYIDEKLIILSRLYFDYRYMLTDFRIHKEKPVFLFTLLTKPYGKQWKCEFCFLEYIMNTWETRLPTWSQTTNGILILTRCVI